MEKLTSHSLSLSIESNGVANLVFDLAESKVNKLTTAVIADLEKAINVIDGNKAIRILIISSAKKDNFIAGADISEIKEIKDYEASVSKVGRGQSIINKIAELKIPTIALINGSCLGGGLELALACKYRVVTTNPKVIIGLPEVNLGIIPGFGGTQRLPLIVGLIKGIEMITTAKIITGEQAFSYGIADMIVPEVFLEEELSKFATAILVDSSKINNRKTSKFNIFLQKIEKFSIVKNIICSRANKKILAKTKGNYPAPIMALRTIAKTYPSKLTEKDFLVELENFCQLAIGQTSKNLIEIFFSQESVKKRLKTPENSRSVNSNIKPINNVAVIGGGIMGGGIAWLFANNRISVRVKDISEKALATCYQQMLKNFKSLLKRRKIKQSELDQKMLYTSHSLNYTGFDNVELAIEAVVEDMEIKKKVLEQIEKNLPKNTIIASNTSALSISDMALALKDKSRFAGMHFFNPVNKMPLVEIIRGKETSQETIDTLFNVVVALGKTPVVVKDVAGFLVNRILMTYICEACYLLQEGNSINKIDSLIANFGMPMGPFLLADVVGIDVGIKVVKTLEENYGRRMKKPMILQELQDRYPSLLGKKSGQGFYIYDKNGKNIGANDEEIDQIILNFNEKFLIKSKKSTDKNIVDRCILQMVNEASKCLEEGVVESARDLDLAMIMGTGFPPFHGGILRYADNIGIDLVVSRLEEFAKHYPERFEVSPLLKKMAVNKEKFINN
jgi:3-hydroxyacyl-CoA dehydrogenase/enoyl-CoA hydratase/3-hydroxybutyryl-CoA epimerase